MVDMLRLQAGQSTFNIREIIVHTTLDLFLEATFGSEMSENDKRFFRIYMAEYFRTKFLFLNYILWSTKNKQHIGVNI